ncbi:MAG: hypothetical protein AB3N13_12140 [Arenibacterium sp.]
MGDLSEKLRAKMRKIYLDGDTSVGSEADLAQDAIESIEALEAQLAEARAALTPGERLIAAAKEARAKVQTDADRVHEAAQVLLNRWFSNTPYGLTTSAEIGIAFEDVGLPPKSVLKAEKGVKALLSALADKEND